ncbi:hypothetical protein EV1_043119 [Malus domestica]
MQVKILGLKSIESILIGSFLLVAKGNPLYAFKEGTNPDVTEYIQQHFAKHASPIVVQMFIPPYSRDDTGLIAYMHAPHVFHFQFIMIQHVIPPVSEDIDYIESLLIMAVFCL